MSSTRKKILTEAQTKALLKELIIHEELYDAGYLQEGIWDTIKYGLSKLGSLEKGGKLAWRPGMTKDEKAAAKKIEDILNKASNNMIKQLDGALKQNFKGFPNMKDNGVFVDALSEIFAVYAGLKMGVEKGEIPCPEANVIIDDLSNYTRHVLDYKLADVYKHFRENQERDGVLLEKGAEDTEGTFGGAGGKSSTIKGLKSRLAPAILALGGATAALGSVLLQQPWFIKLITGPGSTTTAPKTISNILSVDSGEGPTQMMGRIIHGNAGHYGPNVPLGDMLKDMSAAGIIQARRQPVYMAFNMEFPHGRPRRLGSDHGEGFRSRAKGRPLVAPHSSGSRD
jgi:hypothetical protein